MDAPRFKLEDIVNVETKCEICELEGTAPTFKQYIEDETTPLSKQLMEQGYVSITCHECAGESDA